MITHATLVRLEAGADDATAVERFLATARPYTPSNARPAAWFAARFGKGDYGVFQAFQDDAGSHPGPGATPLDSGFGPQEALWTQPPAVQNIEVLASKLPADGELAVEKGLWLTFRAKQGHEDEVAQFLLEAKGIVADEPGTSAWFALQLDEDHFGIFDVFPNNSARFAHLTGHVPREIAKHAFSLLGSMPDMTMLDVVSAKVSVNT